MDCLFCKIVKGEVPANIILSDERIIVFDDVNPQAPEHKLIIPKKHITTLNDIKDTDTDLMGHLIYTATTLAHTLNLAQDGYRIIMNCNVTGGQTVFHIHLHLLGGRQFLWPPG